MIRQDTAKSLAFTRSVHDAWLKIDPDRKLIDPMLLKRLKFRRAQYSEKSSDIIPSRLIVFTSMDCAPCDADIGGLLDELESGRHLGLDFYLLEAAGDVERIQTWARERNIPLGLVQDRTITLNIEKGELETIKDSLGITSDELPLVVRRQGGGGGGVTTSFDLDRRR
jgi:integrating conjugative element protein (TIGR03759 family)